MIGQEIYRLPSEAEWEYAARAGTQTAFSFGNDASELSNYGWFGNNSKSQTQPGGQLKPNTWGLYDMHGNVWEWCQDWYDPEYYSKSPQENPQGPPIGNFRMLRGGAWGLNSLVCRSANRNWSSQDDRSSNVGFRVIAGSMAYPLQPEPISDPKIEITAPYGVLF